MSAANSKRYGFCFVFDPKGRVLVLRRAGHMRARPGDWDLPGGGIEKSETIDAGMSREIFEETALVVVKLEKVDEYSYTHDGTQRNFYYFRADMLAGEPFLSHEHDHFEWHEPLVAATMVTYKPHNNALTTHISLLK